MFIVRTDGADVRVVDAAQLRYLWKSGKFSATSAVFLLDQDRWMILRDVPELIALLPEDERSELASAPTGDTLPTDNPLSLGELKARHSSGASSRPSESGEGTRTLQWRVRIGDAELSASSITVLKDWYSSGRLAPSAYVFHPILQRWMYAGEVEELRAALSTTAINITGAWCPNCKNRNSHQTIGGVIWVVIVIGIVSCGLGLIMIPFLPKTWHCRVCANEWPA